MSVKRTRMQIEVIRSLEGRQGEVKRLVERLTPAPRLTMVKVGELGLVPYVEIPLSTLNELRRAVGLKELVE